VSVAIPVYNEAQVLPSLLSRLRAVLDAIPGGPHQVVFVDDGSEDGTWRVLQQLFGSRPDCELVRHDGNRGLAAAIRTGIAAAGTEIVCSIDSDCTYDPQQLRHMLPLMSDGVDLVTASPYHPKGAVRNVPRWRLVVSRGASVLYGLVLHRKLATYTSCFRVYRRSAVLDLDLREPGYLGIPELVGELDIRGRGIVEHPAILEVRLLGRSKMKILKTVLGHLRLMTRLAGRRLLGGRRPAAARLPQSVEPSQERAGA